MSVELTLDLRRKFFELILVGFASMLLLVDTINGFILLKLAGPSGLSPAFKMTMLFLLFSYAFLYSKKALLLMLAGVLFLLIWGGFRFYLVDRVDFLFAFQEALKVFYFFFIVATISQFKYLQAVHLERILICCVVVLFLNIIASYIGIGFFSYGRYGAKGFFYGGNAVSGIIVICASYFLTKYFRVSMVAFLWAMLFWLTIATIMGTKSGILGVFLCALLVLFIHFDTRSLAILMLLSGVLLLVILMFWTSLEQSAIVDRLIHFYQTGGIERALLSGREDKFSQIMPVYLSGNLLYLLFGVDRAVLMKLGESRIELDFFDMLVYFGAIFTLVVILFYAIVFFRLVFSAQSMVKTAAIIAFIVLALISSIAGHVLFNGIVTPLWGIICAVALAKFGKEQGEAKAPMVSII